MWRKPALFQIPCMAENGLILYAHFWDQLSAKRILSRIILYWCYVFSSSFHDCFSSMHGIYSAWPFESQRFRILVSDERFCDVCHKCLCIKWQMLRLYNIVKRLKKNVVHVILDNVTMSINFWYMPKTIEILQQDEHSDSLLPK